MFDKIKTNGCILNNVGVYKQDNICFVNNMNYLFQKNNYFRNNRLINFEVIRSL